MHQALPVPDWATRPPVRMARAAARSSEFWKRCLAKEDGGIAGGCGDGRGEEGERAWGI